MYVLFNLQLNNETIYATKSFYPGLSSKLQRETKLISRCHNWFCGLDLADVDQ